MTRIQTIIDQMSPEEALAEIIDATKSLFSHLSEEERLDVVVKLIGDAGSDKIGSMVNL